MLAITKIYNSFSYELQALAQEELVSLDHHFPLNFIETKRINFDRLIYEDHQSTLSC